MTRMIAAALAMILVLPNASTAQTIEAARADGKQAARDLLETARAAASAPVDATQVPNYDPQATRGLQDLAQNPDQIEARARASATTNPALRTIRDSMATRAQFDAQDISAMLARSRTISETPLDYTSGMAVGGAQGSCVPLPPGAGSAGTYTATCNSGTRIDQSAGQCAVPLVATITRRQQYHYVCSSFGGLRQQTCQIFEDAGCRHTGYREGPCLQWGGNREKPWCVEPGEPLNEMACDAPVAGETPSAVTADTNVNTAADESQCAGLAGNGECTLDAEICTDSDPETRMVDGVAVTRPCWAWQRSYSCVTRSAASDCSGLEDKGSCRFIREECLSGAEACETWERVYECPLPASETGGTQYVCDGDVYCIDGSCDTIERKANDEFKDAVTALQAMNEARGQFDPQTLTLFRGTRNTCSSKVFGVLNCCKGKGFPLIPGIQLLMALGCNREDVLLHERDAQGLCAYVGTYCSDSFLGVCLTKKKVYCCFESKLSRILQEQGRRQLPKPWRQPKTETCQGFTLDEFARLDLSQMDFSEVYAEFTDAARLPDELETSTLIQQKIQDYYAREGQ